MDEEIIPIMILYSKYSGTKIRLVANFAKQYVSFYKLNLWNYGFDFKKPSIINFD